MAQAQCFSQRKLEHLLGARRERDLARGELLARAHDPRHLLPRALDRNPQRLEHSSGKVLLFAQQAKQDVLGADVVVLERPRLLLGQDDYLTGALGESLKQTSRISPRETADKSAQPASWRRCLSAASRPLQSRFAQTAFGPCVSVTLMRQNVTQGADDGL